MLLGCRKCGYKEWRCVMKTDIAWKSNVRLRNWHDIRSLADFLDPQEYSPKNNMKLPWPAPRGQFLIAEAPRKAR